MAESGQPGDAPVESASQPGDAPVESASQPGLIRARTEGDARQRVSNMELFFDLVFVFAITQLSAFLLGHLTVTGALEAALLLAMVWLLWAYTTWVTNWFDPDKIPVRLLLLALMLVSLVLSAALPDAFRDSGLLVGASYAVMQVGRSLFAVVALRGQHAGSPRHALALNYQRILAWCCVSGAFALAGGLVSGTLPRALLWLAAVCVDLLGGSVGFYTPGLGRASTQDWDIEGGHFAERCQAFILIALGESIVVTGATFAGLLTGPLAHHGPHHAATVTAFLVAFIASAALWWLYFDRSAGEGARLIAASADPGRLGRSAYHFIHPIMVGGVILTAAADDLVLAGPDVVDAHSHAPSWLILGGPAMYIAGHLLFKWTVWRKVSVPRVTALVVLVLLGLLAPHVSRLALSACAAATIVGVAVADYVSRRREAAGSAEAQGEMAGSG
jgi:low temperature requirement protein LtrA